MLPERADEMLRNYKTHLGRCGYLEVLIDRLKREIDVMCAEAREDLINGSGKRPDGMPHGTTIGNPTERIALMLASGIATADVVEARKALTELEKEYCEKIITVHFVEAWFKGLSIKERWIIERQVFDNMTYREINAQYRDAYGESCSKYLLRRLKRDAMTKIIGFAK